MDMIAKLEAQLRINSQAEEENVMKKEGEAPRGAVHGRNRGNLALTCQVSGGGCKEPG